MATFNLSNTNGIAVTRLQPWTINPVVFKGVEEKSGTTTETALAFGAQTQKFQPFIPSFSHGCAPK